MERTSICAFCSFLSSAAVVELCRGFGYDFLVDFVVGKWPELRNVALDISYSIIGYPNVMVDNDQDLDLMVKHHLEVGSTRIDIRVALKPNQCANVVTEYLQNDIPAVVNRPTYDVGNCSSLVIRPVGEVYTSSDVINRSNSEVELLSDRWSNLLTEVGQVFEGGVADFRLQLAKYSIEIGFDYVFKRNTSDKVVVRCSVDGCPWLIHAKLECPGGGFFISKWQKVHSCNGGLRTVKHKRVSSTLVAELFREHIRNKATMRAIDIQQEMKLMYGLDISYFQAWNGKEMALDELRGDNGFSYDRLRKYQEAVMMTNPGSITSFEYDQSSCRFQRSFLAFEACVSGFNHCRPLIFLDGTFLKGKYKGVLLCATGKNGNQGFFPLCFAIVDAENQNNWVWFIQKLAEVLDCQRKFVFMSDRNKGLLEAVSLVFPNSPHGFCLEHLKQNLRTKITVYKGNKHREKLVSLLCESAHARTVRDFSEKMELLKSKGGVHVLNFLAETPVQNWANAYFDGCRYGEMTSNVPESFNSWIREERLLPIDVMVDYIRRKLMEQMAKRLIEAKYWKTTLCPEMETRLQEVMRIGRNWKVIQSNEHIFEVHSDPSCSVDLKARSCSCREWEIKGFPCGHAAAAMQYNKQDVYKFCDPLFKTTSFINSYSSCIYPILSWDNSIETENGVVIKPPLMKRPPGRPKRKRGVPIIDQHKKTMRCTRCNKVGLHNRRSCKEPI